MTPFKIRVYERLRHLYNRRYQYVSTRCLMSEMSIGYWPIYRALKSLEAAGIIQRKSRQSGWRPTILASSVYGNLLINFRNTRDYIPTDVIATWLDTNTRTIRGELTKLEAAGIVQRHGDRGGWRPVRNITTAGDTIVDTIHILHRKAKTHIDTNTIAAELRITPRHARRLLSSYEQQGIITRKGQRLGWQPTYARAG